MNSKICLCNARAIKNDLILKTFFKMDYRYKCGPKV